MSPQSLHLSPWCFPSTRAPNPPHYASDLHICFDPFSHSCLHILTSVALFALQDKMEALGEYESFSQNSFPFVLCLHYPVLKALMRPLGSSAVPHPLTALCLYSNHSSICNTLPSFPASGTPTHCLRQSPNVTSLGSH